MVKNRWRFFGVFVFGFFSFLEMGDLLGILSSNRSGQAFTPLTERLPAEGSGYAILASLGILLASLATTYALLRGLSWARLAAMVTAGLLMAYGVILIFNGVIVHGRLSYTIIFTGGMYILLGMVANWVGQMARSTSQIKK